MSDYFIFKCIKCKFCNDKQRLNVLRLNNETMNIEHASIVCKHSFIISFTCVLRTVWITSSDAASNFEEPSQIKFIVRIDWIDTIRFLFFRKDLIGLPVTSLMLNSLFSSFLLFRFPFPFGILVTQSRNKKFQSEECECSLVNWRYLSSFVFSSALVKSFSFPWFLLLLSFLQNWLRWNEMSGPKWFLK